MSAPAGPAPAPKRPRGRPKRGATAPFDPSEPRLRIFRHEGWRGVFRLEEIFWRALERAAKEQGVRVGAYVKGVVESLEGDANRSAALRTHAGRWMLDRLDAALGQRAPRLVAAAVQTSPIPCFVMGGDRSIKLYNAAFMDWLTGGGPRERLAPGDSPRMTFNIPLAEVVATLRTGQHRVAECEMRAAAFGRTLAARARICLLEYETPDRWTILVYAR